MMQPQRVQALERGGRRASKVWTAAAVGLAVGGAVSGAGDVARESPRADVEVAAIYFPNWHRRMMGTNEVFGEWHNLQRAVPRFPGHAQPKRPLWGVEDEADPAVMAKKIAVAADHGISAFVFCWYHGDVGPHLERALDEGYLRATNRERVKFALMWANHHLHDSVPPQKGEVSRDAFERITRLITDRYFRQAGYWRVGGGFFFSINNARTFVRGMGGEAAAREALDAWRARIQTEGLGELHLNLMDFEVLKEPDPAALVRALGADSVATYCWIHDPDVWRVFKAMFPTSQYADVMRAYFESWDRRSVGMAVPLIPNVTMGWDPTPRKDPARPLEAPPYPGHSVVVGNTPERFEEAMRMAIQRARRLPAGCRVVLVNAWNEWTEGSYLEPEAQTGMAYLEAIRSALTTGAGNDAAGERRTEKRP